MKKEIKQAINDIVTYNTLPSQIDYQLPWKIKADKAEKFLEETLSEKDYHSAMGEAEGKIEDYHNSGAAEMDEMM